LNFRLLAICILTTKAAVLEHDLAAIDVVTESEAAKREPPLALPEGDSLQFLDVMGSAPVMGIGRESLNGSLEEISEFGVAFAEGPC